MALIDAGRVPLDDIYSVREIAEAAGVSLDDAERRLELGRVMSVGGHFPGRDAVRLVRLLASNGPLSADDRAAIATMAHGSRRSVAGLLTSGAAHVACIAAIVFAASLGMMDATTSPAQSAHVSRLVFLSMPGPGGGGGGGGMRQSRPPEQALRKAAQKRRVSSPVPEVRRAPPPPAPRPEPPRPIARVEPKVDPVVASLPPAPPPAVQAPVAPSPADPDDAHGAIAGDRSSASQGSGARGGAGTGSGTGIGEGRGAGIGPGTDAGTGGGPYRAGAGIEPPRLRREVKPQYTDAARRRGVEGEVLVEIVVGRDGTVGDVRILRRLGEGLDEKAIDAVRQWTFDPARRHGVPVDVIVEVSLQFKLR